MQIGGWVGGYAPMPTAGMEASVPSLKTRTPSVSGSSAVNQVS